MTFEDFMCKRLGGPPCGLSPARWSNYLEKARYNETMLFWYEEYKKAMTTERVYDVY